MQKGTIAVQTENIFPIIKKFLYADHDIFLRELVSNAVDATTKLKVLANSGKVKGEIGDTTIEVKLDSEAKTLTISDKGIGMTEDEVLKYLNQIAFSSATEFLDTYKDSGIIGHFGLGFYSAFMVSDKVEVRTKSFKEGAEAVCWTCDGTPNYTIETIEKESRGTDIILYVSDEEAGFLEKQRIDSLLEKYCSFLPVEIQFGTKTEFVTDEAAEKDEELADKEVEVPNIINETLPIWKKPAKDLTDEDYKAFYRKMFPMSPEPMFWIHLNIDFPFNLTGVLYFPKLGNAMEISRNKIHLYSNQVYVTDDVRDIVPEWLLLLHGVIDSPDIPLNVSRSYLQSDGNVKKITQYITKKVGDKLEGLFKNDRPAFESKWSDLGNFVKYGMVSEEKFQAKAMKFALLQNTKDEFSLLEDYKEKIKTNQTDKNNKVVCIYTHAPGLHDGLIKAAEKRGYDVLLMQGVLDNHWMQHLEYKADMDFVFVRIDSDTLDKLVQKDEEVTSILSEDEEKAVKALFEKTAATGATVQLAALTPDDAPVNIVRPEFMRRMAEMQMMHGGADAMKDMFKNYNVVVNSNHPVVATKLLKIGDAAAQEDMAQYLTSLALLQHGMLEGADLTNFLAKALEKA